MKNTFAASLLVVLFAMALPVMARDTHAGKPTDPGVVAAGRDTHAGRPGDVSVMGPKSYGGMEPGGLIRSGRISRPIAYPMAPGIPGFFFDVFTYFYWGMPGLF
jgi:hypothetical protein